MSSAQAPEVRTWANPQQLVGSTLDDRYRLERLLGAGGMGAVFVGQQMALRKDVAIKVLDPRLAAKPRHVERFLREARAASKIRNLHVVDISDFGHVPGGSVYYVMELLDGRDLSHVIREARRLPWPRARSILLQMAHALQAAHDCGVVHRDIKPANCVIVPDPDDPNGEFVKVVDFGIAKMLELEGESNGLTRPNEIMGTVAYMAPEQALCRTVDVRTDVYSLGAVAFEMLTGRVPFAGGGTFETLEMHIRDAPPSLRSIEPSVSPALDNVILKALQKRPEDRYQSMQAFERALRGIDDEGQHVPDDGSELGNAPTIGRDAPSFDPSPSNLPSIDEDTSPDTGRATARSLAPTGMSRGALWLLWVGIVLGGFALGAWLVARFLL